MSNKSKNLERIIIVGCGQHANVVIYNIKAQNKYEVIGYFDSDENKSGLYFGGYKVIENYPKCDLAELKKKYNTNKFFIGFGNMKYRRLVYEQFSEAGWDAVNIFHPNAVISADSKIGKGVLIEAGCLITPNPIIGNNVVINTGSQVNHDNIIKNHVYIASGVILSGGVTIGENTLIDDGVIVSLGKSVSEECIIGAGAVVTKDLLIAGTYFGIPAKLIEKV